MDPCQRRSLTFYSFAPRPRRRPSVIPFTFPSRPSSSRRVFSQMSMPLPRRRHRRRPALLQRRLVMTKPDARRPVKRLVHVIQVFSHFQRTMKFVGGCCCGSSCHDRQRSNLVNGREESVLRVLRRTREGKDWGMITNLFERSLHDNGFVENWFAFYSREASL